MGGGGEVGPRRRLLCLTMLRRAFLLIGSFPRHSHWPWVCATVPIQRLTAGNLAVLAIGWPKRCVCMSCLYVAMSYSSAPELCPWDLLVHVAA